MGNIENRSEIAGIVPAAGKSTRMGTDKRLLPLGEYSLLERSVKTLIDAGCAPVVVVTEPNSPCQKLPYLVNEAQSIVVPLPEDSPSMLFTIVQGLRYVPDHVRGIAVLPGDCPLIAPTLIRMLNNFFTENNCQLLVPLYQGQQGHPRYVASTMFEKVRNTDLKGRFSSIFKENQEKVTYIEINDESIIVDSDTPTEYDSILKKYD